MVITQPTVDDFSDTTVMRVIRKIVNYICNDLVDGINNNDIVSGKFSVKGNQLSGTLTKGDGTTINIPAATLPSGGGGGSDNPYPTAVSMTLSGTILNFNMTMSSGTPIMGSVNLAPILEGYVTDTELQDEISGLKLSSTNNNMTFNGSSVSIVKSVSGNVSEENDLTITVNGINSTPIALPANSNGNIYIEKDINNSSDITIADSYDWLLFKFRYNSVDYVFIGPLICTTDKSVISSSGTSLPTTDGSIITGIRFESTGIKIYVYKDGSSNTIENPSLANQITMILKFGMTI